MVFPSIWSVGMVKAVSAAPTKSDRRQVAPIASHVKCFRQEPRSRRLALTASAGQHFLPALRGQLAIRNMAIIVEITYQISMLCLISFRNNFLYVEIVHEYYFSGNVFQLIYITQSV